MLSVDNRAMVSSGPLSSDTSGLKLKWLTADTTEDRSDRLVLQLKDQSDDHDQIKWYGKCQQRQHFGLKTVVWKGWKKICVNYNCMTDSIVKFGLLVKIVFDYYVCAVFGVFQPKDELVF